MANCTSCGRELPVYRSPRLSTLCVDCQTIENAREAASAPQRTPTSSSSAINVSLTTILIGINSAVFIAMVATGVSPIEPTSQDLLKWGANFGPLSLGSQPWRMLTSNYEHIGIIHIFFNMWCLLNLGKLAERIFDRWTYIFVYNRHRTGRQFGQSVVASAGSRGRRIRSNFWTCGRADCSVVLGKTSRSKAGHELHFEEPSDLCWV